MENTENKDIQMPVRSGDAEAPQAEHPVAEDKNHSSSGSGHHHHHHHSGEGHHSHHSSKHRKSNKRSAKSKVGRFIARHKATFGNVAVIVLAFLAVFAIAYLGEMRYNKLEDAIGSGQGDSSVTDASFRVEVSLFDKEVSLVGEAVTAYMRADSSIPVGQITDKYKETDGRMDIGAAVVVSYRVHALPKGCSVQSVTLEVSERGNDSAPRSFTADGDQTDFSVKHLKTGTQYDYKFTFLLSGSVETSVSGAFRTAAGPRVLSIGGLVNVRDIGGWKTTDGKTVRQGLLYRGSEMDGAVASAYRITSEGVSDMLTVLGIRSEMDLRTEEHTPNHLDALGANVIHKYYACQMYQSIFTEQGKDAVQKVFSDLAKPEMYPTYLHCTYGADRTGTICYLLEALLGVSEEDVIREYELSGLVHGTLTRDNLTEMRSRLNAYEGNTLQQKVESFLLSVGVTADEITSIREIFLEA